LTDADIPHIAVTANQEASMQQLNPTQEAKNLNVRLEQDNGEWIAVLPPHPDLKDDEEVGFPAPTEQEALDEARAYRAIEQSKVYKFEYDEKRDLYIVNFADQKHADKLLAQAYRKAQEAYVDMLNKEAPEPEAPAPAPAKTRRKRNGGQASHGSLHCKGIANEGVVQCRMRSIADTSSTMLE